MNIKKETLIVLLVLSISLISGAKADDAVIPGEPISLAVSNMGNFWVNYTWSAGANTDSFNISVNGNWTNGTKDLSINTKSSPHAWVNISVAGYNAKSGRLSDFVAMATRVRNNPITLTDIQSSYFLYEGQTLYIDANYTDSDGDKGIFATNATKGTFDVSTGIFSWKTSGGDSGIYNWQISVTDGYGGISLRAFTVIVNQNTPGSPNLAYTTGNSWVNYTWSPISNTDSFNISINGQWYNGTKDLFKNTTISPHGWVNISLAGYNAISHTLFNLGSMATQIPDNPITLTNVSDRYFLNEGDTLYISPNYIDTDGDKGVFATNAACITNSKCTFDPSTGILSWTTGPDDGGIYNWLINVTDGYGSISTQQFKVIVPMRREDIRFIEPAIISDKEQWVNAKVGHIGKLIGINATIKNTGEDSLILTVTEIYNNTKTEFPQLSLAKDQSFSYGKEFEINSTIIEGGLLNYTFEIKAIGFNGRDFTFIYSNTTTISLPIKPIFKMKRANYDQVYVSQTSKTHPITYTLEANSSVNLTNVSIYDPFYPNKYFNISKLEANKPNSTSYTYQATIADSSKYNCEEPYKSCIINLATFTGYIESSGELINDTDYVRIPVGTISNGGSSSGGRSSGGGGGGGGMPPSEDFNNIERREVREMDILAKMAAAYTFKAAEPVMVVSFESNTSENSVPVAVEVLKNRSKRIGEDAPGKVYKYFNIFVGMSGFSKRVSKGVVAFRVNNSWLDENGLDPKDISLYKWEGHWVEKSTEIAERTPNHTYYASLTGNFSSFAVAGVKKADEASEIKTNISNESNKNTTQKLANSSIDFSLIIWIIAIVGVISVLYYLRKMRVK